MTALRSFLFIPGDSEKKLGKVDGCGADAVILDLEDAVAPAAKPLARRMVADFLKARPREERAVQLWVRVNPFDTGLTEADVAAIIAGAPDGIMQPKIDGPACVARLSALLDEAERAHGIAPGSTRILPVATETPIAPFRLGDFAGAGLTRLAGLTWGAEDLSAAMGASTNLGPDGAWAFTYRMVRSLTLMAAHAAGVPAYETLYVDFRDDAGLRASCREARAEGWAGRIAIHPAQVPGINASFAPSAEELAFARRVIDAFAAQPDAGTVGIDGRMYDIPHLKAARRTLDLAQ
ncbi:CoA ester lyase [Novosphingobium sp. fls2-241-R2A-195]|jgi:citrate lyase subunit beta/citryl-CoA lyase|uniref:HpcH/HpaI aldolase/citrate lyase family protein n=1 Tax=Novosphingobium sp. fls2-241-R2A-195 TaxID=3040296 RepID=UPI0025506BC6|nr:CoA ester lyase [Novosphingobium sp. fls2-241-R2A-195]